MVTARPAPRPGRGVPLAGTFLQVDAKGVRHILASPCHAEERRPRSGRSDPERRRRASRFFAGTARRSCPSNRPGHRTRINTGCAHGFLSVPVRGIGVIRVQHLAPSGQHGIPAAAGFASPPSRLAPKDRWVNARVNPMRLEREPPPLLAQKVTDTRREKGIDSLSKSCYSFFTLWNRFQTLFGPGNGCEQGQTPGETLRRWQEQRFVT